MSLDIDGEEHLARAKRFEEEAVASVWGIGPDDAEGFFDAACRAGRMNGPAMLFDWWAGAHRCKVDQGALRAVVADIWSSADVPERLLSPRSVWVGLFRQADYSDTLPSKPVTLYRGAHPGRRRGMSWTTDLDRATWFAKGWIGNGIDHSICKVYTVTATPDMMLCDIDKACGDGGRGECEIVLDPFKLRGTKVLGGAS
jgi:hypothetical protein